MMSWQRDVVAAVVMLASVGAAGASAQNGEAPVCQPTGAVMPLADLPEASGLAIGGASAGRLWLHNDSGAPVLIAVDARGKLAGRLTVNGARVEDWEAITSGRCGNGSCLYVGDIGDNEASRKQITIYRIAEPAQASGSVASVAFHATYPDGAHDAEALLAAPDGTLYIVTKGDTGPVAVYKFPRDLQSGATVKLERVGDALVKQPAADERITDGAFSADGHWVVLRTNTALTFYRAEEFVRGIFKEARRINLSGLREPQGEAVAFGAKNTLYLAGEGRGKKQPGTLAVLSCNF